MSRTEAPERDAEPQTRRRQVLWFVGLTLVLSFAFQAWMIRSAGGLQALGGLSPVVLMWVPAVVSVGMRLVGREGFRDVGWRAGPWRLWAAAYALPVFCAAVTYGAAWLAGVVVFAPAPSKLAIESVHLRWAVIALINGSLGVAIGAIAALGEELGWRGYLLTRWVQAKLPYPVLGTGLIWAVWHAPLIAWGDYATSSVRWLSVLLFVVTVTLATSVFVWLRLAGGSVWTAVIAHAVHNAWYQGVFDRHFRGELEPYFAGEAGVFSIAAYGAVALWLWRSGRLKRCVEQPVLYPTRHAAEGG
jgi:membrane protease YdiL (CAAX protease family)